MTDLASIIAAIIAALNVDLGTVDLSATGQVLEGTYNEPPGSVAFACLPPARETRAEPQARNAYYLRTWQQPVRLWAPTTAGTPANAVQQARTLADEAVTALDTARATGGNALWKCIRYAVTEIVPDEVVVTDAPSWSYVTLTIELTYRIAAGDGV